MADYYCLTSFEITKDKNFPIQDFVNIINSYEMENINIAPKLFQEKYNVFDFGYHGPLDIKYKIENDNLWICSELHFDTETISKIIQAILIQYDLDTYITFQIALTCNKPRIDSFSGMGVFITKEAISTCDISDWVNLKIKEYQAKK